MFLNNQICDAKRFLSLLMICSIMFSRYEPSNDSYHQDMEGNGVICSAVDILPTEFAKEVKYSHPGISFLLFITFPPMEYL